MKLTYYGHACFLANVGGKNLLFDPYITLNELAKNVDTESIPVDYLLLSHGHEDHIADAEAILKRTGAKLISNYEIVTWFGGKGFEDGHPMNHGGAWNFDFGKVKYLNAVHSSVLPDGTYGGNPGGFLIQGVDETFYYAGDTALTMDMKLIPDMAKLNFAILPLGDNFTMGVDDAVKAAEFIQCDKIIGMHYDTFGFIEIDHNEAKDKFKQAGKELFLMNIGETVEVGSEAVANNN
ncbi:MAG: metal-dependent hydrolase [Bacteroidetes bacterium]|nr:metal-dependent hydrolase [Bacteroidota bacterium]